MIALLALLALFGFLMHEIGRRAGFWPGYDAGHSVGYLEGMADGEAGAIAEYHRRIRARAEERSTSPRSRLDRDPTSGIEEFIPTETGADESDAGEVSDA